ncbi:hypothetical protein Tco_0309928 [Tanacetum coccineum]
MSHFHAVKGNWGSAVKTSAGYNWRNSNQTPIDHTLKNMVDRDIFNSGCSWHMAYNKDQLEDFEEFNGGCPDENHILLKEEPKKIAEALQDDSWVQAMQEELLQFKLQQVWVLVDLPHGMKVIGTRRIFHAGSKCIVDDIIFGLTKKSWFDEFEALMEQRKSYNMWLSFLGTKTYLMAMLRKQTLVAYYHTTEVEYLAAEIAVDSIVGSKSTAGLWVCRDSGFSPRFQPQATIDTIVYTITEASIRHKLQLADASGITMLPNNEIFEGMGHMGSKSGGWDQFGSNIATALICLSTGREEDSLAEAIVMDNFGEEEEAKQVHLDSLLAQRIAEEEELNEQQKKRRAQVQFEAQHYTDEDWDLIRAKIEANAELSKSVLGSDLQGEDFAKKMVELGTWKLSQLKNLSFEEVKEEFDKLVKQVESFAPINFEATKDSLKRFGEELQTKTSKRLKSDESTKKTRKRRKQDS